MNTQQDRTSVSPDQARAAPAVVIDPQDETAREKRNRILRAKDIQYATTRKAWFTLSHMLLPMGAKVANMGCGDGALTFTMAALRPDLQFIGLDKNRRYINKAKATYELPNLEFKVGDTSNTIFEDESLDAIINNNILHVIYSSSSYNPQIVSETLQAQFKALKTGGTMFIRDFARPPPEQFVLLELLDKSSPSDRVEDMSEADLLVWYAEHARPKQDAGFGGFFLEELPPRIEGKRLFRLPYKWAYEFLLRKDDRKRWTGELPMEYMLFTPREFRQELRSLGARVTYSGPHWDEDYIRKNFDERKMRLFADDGAPLGDPPTSFIATAVKMAERKSLKIGERRPTQSVDTSLKIIGMRNSKNGAFVDVVSRDQKFSEMIPYRIDTDGALKIFLHDGVARSIPGSVLRSGTNIDGKQWSGHMVEAISLAVETLSETDEFTPKKTAEFVENHIGLQAENGTAIVKGPDYYPSPDYIDERIFTFYVKTKQTKGNKAPKPAMDHAGKFHAKGTVREFYAQNILDAIAVGMIPNARLELQILSLYEHLDLQSENWVKKDFQVKKGEITSQLKMANLLSQLSNNSKRFQETPNSHGQLRPVHSTFVEEGRAKGLATGISAQDVDFIIHSEKTINTAVVLPIVKGMKNDLHAGFQMQHMPIPQRYAGNSSVASAPSFNIPPDAVTLKDVKKFLADQYGVMPDMIFKLGESYYSHIGITPQKIHPFAVAAPPEVFKDTDTQFMPFYQLMLMQKALKTDSHFMITVARSFKMFHADIQLDMERRASAIVKERFGNAKPEWSLPLQYHSAPVDSVAIGEKNPAPEEPQIELTKPKPFHARLTDEFSEEIEDFIEELGEMKNDMPKPESW